MTTRGNKSNIEEKCLAFSAHVFGSKSIRHDARVAIGKNENEGGIEVILIRGSVNSLP
jgi:hypothetical protein